MDRLCSHCGDLIARIHLPDGRSLCRECAATHRRLIAAIQADGLARAMRRRQRQHEARS